MSIVGLFSLLKECNVQRVRASEMNYKVVLNFAQMKPKIGKIDRRGFVVANQIQEMDK